MLKCEDCEEIFFHDEANETYEDLMLTYEEMGGFKKKKYLVCPFCGGGILSEYR